MTAYIGSLLTPLYSPRDMVKAGFAPHTEGDHHSPVKMQRIFSLLQQLLLEGLFFQETFCHKGSSKIHFNMAYIKEAQVLIICETSNSPVYVIGEKVKWFCSTFHWWLKKPSTVWSISKVSLHHTTVSCGLQGTNAMPLCIGKVTNHCLYCTCWLTSCTCITLCVDKDSWFMAANMRRRRFTTCYGWIVWEIYMDTFVHISEPLSYLLMPSPARQARCYWPSDKQHATACRFALRVHIRKQDYLV